MPDADSMPHSRRGVGMIRGRESASPTFKVGDRIRLRARYIQLFPGDSGVIVGVLLDPMRSLFNEYLVQFPDQSKASLFQFQICIDEKAWNIS
jgi:hypothetical protein